MAGVAGPVEFAKKPRGPLSQTFHSAIKRAEQLGWLTAHAGSGDYDACNYELGPKAEEGIRIAFHVLADQDQMVEDVLFYLEGDSLIQAELQATVHKAWADLRASGKVGTQAEVVEAVQHWKPNRPGFEALMIKVSYKDLKDRKLIP